MSVLSDKIILTEKEKMITFKHTINFVTEVDEKTMPADLLSKLLEVPETEMNKMLARAFIQMIKDKNLLEEANKSGTWAILKLGDNND